MKDLKNKGHSTTIPTLSDIVNGEKKSSREPSSKNTASQSGGKFYLNSVVDKTFLQEFIYQKLTERLQDLSEELAEEILVKLQSGESNNIKPRNKR